MGDACDPGSMKPTRLVGHVVWWWGSAPFAIGYPVAVRGLRLRNDTGRHCACGLFATSHGSGNLRVGGVLLQWFVRETTRPHAAGPSHHTLFRIPRADPRDGGARLRASL